MANEGNRYVRQREDGKWANQRNGTDRAASLHRTQAEANEAARENLRNQGGGELTTFGRHNRIVSKDTIGGNDPRSIRDKEH